MNSHRQALLDEAALYKRIMQNHQKMVVAHAKTVKEYRDKRTEVLRAIMQLDQAEMTQDDVNTWLGVCKVCGVRECKNPHLRLVSNEQL